MKYLNLTLTHGTIMPPCLHQTVILSSITDGEKFYHKCLTVLMLLCNVMRSSSPEMFCKRGVLRIFIKFTGKHLCCELCEISKNTLFHRTLLVAASLYCNLSTKNLITLNRFFLIFSDSIFDAFL